MDRACIVNSGLSGRRYWARMHQTKASTSHREYEDIRGQSVTNSLSIHKWMPEYIEDLWCEGEVASVQGEYGIYDFLGTDDGRGVLSARELSDDYG